MREFFASLKEKHKLFKILRKCLKILKNFLRNLQICIILAYFSKKFSYNALIFRVLRRKAQIVGKFEKILKISIKIQ